MSRMYLAAVILFVFTSLAAAAEPVTPELWRQWQASPDTHPIVPNVSYAGVGYGEKPLPRPAVVVKVADHGAVGDGKADDTRAIRAALQAAADKGGGAVLLGEGRFRITQPIFLRYDNVVLRGSGPGKTEIYADASLQDSYGRNYSGSKSRWSWSGGMLWFAPIERRADQFIGQDKYREGWFDTQRVTEVLSEAERGDRMIVVRSAAGLKAGDRLLLTLTDPGDHSLFKAMAGDIPGTDRYDWATEAAGIVDTPTWRWPVQIESIDRNRVTLRQPLRLRIEREWKPALTTTGPLVTGAGVEDLTLRMKPARLSPHLLNPGYNGIFFENAWDCFARNVVLIDVDNGIGTAASKCVTVDRFRIEGRKCHHATFSRVGSHDVLWTRFDVTAECHHGLNTEGLSSGNVWSAGNMEHGTLDSHRALPFASVRTDMVIHNDGRHGGGPTAGPLFGARFVHWNIQVTNDRPHMVHTAEMMPRGAVVGVCGTRPEPKPYPDFPGPMQSVVQADGKRVLPVDLHVAQLAHRLGEVPHHLGRDIDLSVHRNDGQSLLLKWVEPFAHRREYRIARQADDRPWNEAYAQASEPRFVDRKVEPGVRYSYRVQPMVESVALPWSETETMLNRPPRIEQANWRPLIEPTAVELTWQRTPEQAGRIRIQRKPLKAGDEAWRDVERIAIDQASYVDRGVEPGERYAYRVTVVNASGESEPVALETFTRAADTRKLVERFTRSDTAALPAASTGEQNFGQWQWRGSDRDRRPALRADSNSPFGDAKPTGTLAWPYTPDRARSFTWAEGIDLDLSDLGAEVRYDYVIGRSGISTHAVGLCLQLAGKTWITSYPGHTEQLMNWYQRSHLIEDTDWYNFDAENIRHGERVEDPDLSNITAIGFYIDRPINMRYIQFDNITIWGK